MHERLKKRIRVVSLLGLLVVIGFVSGLGQELMKWRNPVLPSSGADPSVIEFHGEYWAAVTSGGQPHGFPLYHSTDLVHWAPAGAIFPVWPEWMSDSLWAPELVNDAGNVRVYYAARNRIGVLCVGVATASDGPSGRWVDRGPLVCQPDGSIDPSFIRDEHGQPYLIWKEDGNSRHRPTSIWAQPLEASGVALQGSPHKLIGNDVPWEGNVVEGPFILRHSGMFYLFYAGSGCCGDRCNYAEGVARAQQLLGPWEKNPENPFIRGDSNWRCPGHGTVVEKGGRDFLLFHAYQGSSADPSAPRDRQTVLERPALARRMAHPRPWRYGQHREHAPVVNMRGMKEKHRYGGSDLDSPIYPRVAFPHPSIRRISSVGITCAA